MQHTNTFSQNGMVLVSTCFHKGGAKGKVLSFFQTLSNCLCLGCVSKKGPCKDSLEEGTHTKTHSLKCTTVYSYIYIYVYFLYYLFHVHIIYIHIYTVNTIYPSYFYTARLARPLINPALCTPAEKTPGKALKALGPGTGHQSGFRSRP